MCVKIGEQVKTSKTHVLLVGIIGICPCFLALVLCGMQLKYCKEHTETESKYNYNQTHPEECEYYMYGIALSVIYILPSILMIFGVLIGWKYFMIPWLVIAMIYMAGNWLFFAKLLLHIMEMYQKNNTLFS